MEHDGEIWQLYSLNGESIIGSGWESAKNNPEISGGDEIVGAVAVFLYRTNKDHNIEFLWQKRSEKVSRNPGYYDFSVAGHINLNESPIEALKRECFEKIGVKISEKDPALIAKIMTSKNRFVWFYMINWTKKDENFLFNDQEVSEVKWVTCAEMKNFWQTKSKPPLQANCDIYYALIIKWLKMHGCL